jgi:hypothetical protein
MGDPEIAAMSSVANALIDLDEDARARVLRWTAERFGVALAVQGGLRVDGAASRLTNKDVIEGETAAEALTFEHFAELFAKAQPKSEADKALVAAYWVQVIQGKDQWGSRLLNTELKHLGYSLSNVTRALSTNMKKKPQLVIQLKKSGSSQQSTKTYKATNEGIVYVQGMLSDGHA